jgi:uncharacterized membrane protein
MGFLEITVKPRLRRIEQQEEAEAEGDDDDDDDSVDAALPTAVPEQAQPNTSQAQPNTTGSQDVESSDKPKSDENNNYYESNEHFEARIRHMRIGKEIRQQAFLNDPFLTTKIFFSSYFYDKGWFPYA